MHRFKFLSTFWVLTALHLFFLFPGPVHLDLGDTIPLVTYAPTVSSILGIISDVTNNYSTLRVRKRKYLWYFNSFYLVSIPCTERSGIWISCVYIGVICIGFCVQAMLINLGSPKTAFKKCKTSRHIMQTVKFGVQLFGLFLGSTKKNILRIAFLDHTVTEMLPNRFHTLFVISRNKFN